MDDWLLAWSLTCYLYCILVLCVQASSRTPALTVRCGLADCIIGKVISPRWTTGQVSPNSFIILHCCGSEIRCLFDPQTHIFWELQFCEICGYKKRYRMTTNFFRPFLLLLFLDPGIRDPGSGMDKNRDSGVNIPDPQHCNSRPFALYPTTGTEGPACLEEQHPLLLSS